MIRQPIIPDVPGVRVLGLSMLGLAAVYSSEAAAQLELSGGAHLSFIDPIDQVSFVERGISPFRFDDDDNPWQLSQLYLNAEGEIFKSVSAHVSVHYYDDLDHDPDITQAYFSYTPLPINGYRFKARAGAFYPNMSMENTAAGWMAELPLSNSVINTWMGEELRTSGLELSLTRPGRRFRSPWSWTVSATLHKANDPLASVLAWRGWSTHDRQFGLNERIPLGNYLGLRSGPLTRQTRELDLIDEIDGRWGWIGAVRLRYTSRLDIRLHYFDNNGDPETFSEGQWTWDTRFTQLAVGYHLNNELTFLGQWMRGDTETGRRLVVMDFDAAYLALRWKRGNHRVQVRYDHYSTDDLDANRIDDNNGDGHNWSLGYVYDLGSGWQLAAEWQTINSRREARVYLTGTQNLDVSHRQVSLVYRW